METQGSTKSRCDLRSRDTPSMPVLGIGAWGTNGMAIAQGKLAIYAAAAGIDPSRVILVMIDAGTDNEALLNDPLYVGVRHARTALGKTLPYVEPVPTVEGGRSRWSLF